MGDLTDLFRTMEEEPSPVRKPEKEKKPAKLNNKSRKKQIVKEVGVFNTVMNHESFKEDPVEAILQHLRNTVGKGE